ncbi:DUF3710 domain-containing protein [Pseudactinotalea sp.]|uniref:DUF3710 domain-containing protein n=1 Tax=Pseudactinotalea sp. TaxID=1926260 RepID=UPI003B3A82D3
MRWFSRKAREETEQADAVDVAEEAVAEPEGRGPWDVEDVPEVGQRVDLGALRIPMRTGMQVRMELERKSRRIVAVNLALDGSALQLQAFAAPRSAGLWEELRGEIGTTITKQGGSSEEQDGPFGTELLARLPVRTPDGRSGTRAARFIGIDGPRWFIRGVLTGKASSDADAAAAMEQVLADVVVVRGHEARAPRDLLGLHMPGKPGQEVPAATATRPSIDLGSPRGPEITEVR